MMQQLVRACALSIVLVSINSAQAPESTEAASVAPAPSSGPVLTYRDLLWDVAELGDLAKQSRVGFQVRNVSSRNPVSTNPQAGATWFVEGDAGNFVRTEQRGGTTEYVLFEQRGPGSVMRLWAANPAGKVHFYFDGATEPSITMDFAKLLSGQTEEFPAPIAIRQAGAGVLYYPLPYNRALKITTDTNPGGGLRYDITFRTYPRNVTVPTFSLSLHEEYKAVMQNIRYVKTRPWSLVEMVGRTTRMEGRAGLIEPGDRFLALIQEGPFAVTQFDIAIAAEDIDRALRETILVVRADDIDTVVCPIGDFFGSAPGNNRYRAFPLCMFDRANLRSKWVMPTKSGVEIFLVNKGDQSVRVEARGNAIEWIWDENSMYFFANWRQSPRLSTRPPRDWTAAEIQGKGRFVGVSLHARNPVPEFWGLGDVKLYLDGNPNPAIASTGTTDFFGVGGNTVAPFEHAYYNFTRADVPGNYGDIALNRFFMLDNVPFERGLRLDFGVMHEAETEISLASTVYWYGLPGAKGNFEGFREMKPRHEMLKTNFVAPKPEASQPQATEPEPDEQSADAEPAEAEVSPWPTSTPNHAPQGSEEP